MTEDNRKPPAIIRKNACACLRRTQRTGKAVGALAAKRSHTFICCLFLLLAPTSAGAADAPHASVGEAYVYNSAKEQISQDTHAPGLANRLDRVSPNAAELLDPTSHVWAGAQGLSLRLGPASVLLDTDVVASAGDAAGAAASHPDGSISLYGLGNCTRLSMPGNDPAYALALAREGSVLVAWDQGANTLVSFDLAAPGCPVKPAPTKLRGTLSLSLSAQGDFLAAQDETGQIWIGPRGAEMQPVAKLKGAPAAIGFSGGEGVLLVIDAQGNGGAWNPRNGNRLRTVSVPGGPFAGGSFLGFEARMSTPGGQVVRWDMLHNRAAGQEEASSVSNESRTGWLEQHGTELRFTRTGTSWKATPVYEPRLPQLSESARADCLRLVDVDGMVRYFDARTGLPKPQCFADDWAPVSIAEDGTARTAQLSLRVYNRLQNRLTGSQVNARAVSRDQVYFWTDGSPKLTLHIQTGSAQVQSLLKAAEMASQTAINAISVPFLQGISEKDSSESILLP